MGEYNHTPPTFFKVVVLVTVLVGFGTVKLCVLAYGFIVNSQFRYQFAQKGGFWMVHEAGKFQFSQYSIMAI